MMVRFHSIIISNLFFAKEKRYGSKDRKNIATLCYSYFRSGNALNTESVSEKIIASEFLMQQSHSDFLAELKPEWNKYVALPLVEKLSVLNQKIDQVFPCINHLSGEIDSELFISSLFIQPALYLRVRPGNSSVVKNKLSAAAVPFELIAEDRISLPNGTKIEEIVKINEEVVIQDMNSQKVLDYLKPHDNSVSEIRAWDCCAASGGKSILLYDRLHGKVRLTVTDIRETILSKLHTRLQNARIPIENSYLVDLTKSGLPDKEKFDIVICDAPCTGSGTWSRTPEQMYYFHTNKIDKYALMQREIITNAITSLKTGSLFFYITCSVFVEENERQGEFIANTFALKPVHTEYLKGYEDKADTMFVAIFRR